jgi:hypothetical protein
VFSVEHYMSRASELEAAAKLVSDLNIRASYLELARTYRAMANAASIAESMEADEAVKLAERMIGKTLGTH